MKTDYQKINTLFMRDEKNIIIPIVMTCPEFDFLKECKWEATEKIDETNIHIDILCNHGAEIEISIHGRTEKAEIPEHLLNRLKELFTPEIINRAFEAPIKSVTDESMMISIYGEGYGFKIQKGKNYIKDGVDFILFDVKVGNWWLRREDCEDIAKALGVNIVPLIGMMTIPEAIEYVKDGFKSTIADNKDYEAEGLILKTPCALRSRSGERIITKILVSTKT